MGMATKNLDIRIKRIYEPPDTCDGRRFLVDRLWPRGLRREDLQLDGWLKDVAPSDTLRAWFGHDQDRWQEFRERYFAELDRHPATWASLADIVATETVTLLFAARDERHNNAVALREYLLRNSQRPQPQTGRRRSLAGSSDKSQARAR